MKAIETRYKGYRFRSRLEARWAVFLDALNTKYSYEREGYDLSGQWYLPDFYVPDWNCWIEIKGQEPSADEIAKCEALARTSGKIVLMIIGDPWAADQGNDYDVRLFNSSDLADAGAEDRWGSRGWEFGQGRRCEEEIWLVNDELGAFTLKGIPHKGDDRYPLSGTWAKHIVNALSAAREARFEHGETPKL
jgi:hypothetical protein